MHERLRWSLSCFYPAVALVGAALGASSKSSFTTCKLRFLVNFRLAPTALTTLNKNTGWYVRHTSFVLSLWNPHLLYVNSGSPKSPALSKPCSLTRFKNDSCCFWFDLTKTKIVAVFRQHPPCSHCAHDAEQKHWMMFSENFLYIVCEIFIYYT